MFTKTLLSLSFAAALVAPAVFASPVERAVGDTSYVSASGKKFAKLTVTRVDKGTVQISTDTENDIDEALDKSLNTNYDLEGDAEYSASVEAQGQKIDVTLDTDNAHASLKEAFTKAQWTQIHGQITTSLLYENEEDEKTPKILTVGIQNSNTAGNVVGPCKETDDCVYRFEYLPKDDA